MDALLNGGASCDMRDNRGLTPLHDAVVACKGKCSKAEQVAQRLALVKRLLAAAGGGAAALANIADVRGSTALHFAAFHNLPEVAEELLGCGADPECALCSGVLLGCAMLCCAAACCADAEGASQPTMP